jgi:hypothetical protein
LFDSPKIACRFSGISLHTYRTNTIKVSTGYASSVSMLLEKGQEATEQEFNKVYHEALSQLTMEAVIEATEPATEEEKAGTWSDNPVNEIFNRNNNISHSVNSLAL